LPGSFDTLIFSCREVVPLYLLSMNLTLYAVNGISKSIFSQPYSYCYT
jgi:hypothetical protein